MQMASRPAASPIPSSASATFLMARPEASGFESLAALSSLARPEIIGHAQADGEDHSRGGAKRELTEEHTSDENRDGKKVCAGRSILYSWRAAHFQPQPRPTSALACEYCRSNHLKCDGPPVCGQVREDVVSADIGLLCSVRSVSCSVSSRHLASGDRNPVLCQSFASNKRRFQLCKKYSLSCAGVSSLFA
jgi:hypothetical protein